MEINIYEEVKEEEKQEEPKVFLRLRKDGTSRIFLEVVKKNGEQAEGGNIMLSITAEGITRYCAFSGYGFALEDKNKIKLLL